MGASALAWDGCWEQGCRLEMLQGDQGRALCVHECVGLDRFACVCVNGWGGLHVCESVCMCICACISICV